MKWSWKIARIAGIDVNIHTTFLLLVIFVAISYGINGGSPAMIVEGVLFLLALFACVLFHEFGHAIAARRFGIPTRDITLLPIGGVARLERMPEKPRQELWVALAGPAVNVVIAAVLFVGLWVTQAFEPFTQLSVTGGNFFERLLVINIWLVLFNLIPAFPMDGGRVVRALLATRLDYVRATQIAATLGQGLAFLMGLLGLFGNPALLFIAFFVWIGAVQEASMVQLKSAMSGIPVNRVMLTDFETLSPTDPLSRPIELLLAGSQRDFPVVANASLVGILTRDDLIQALTTHKETLLVSYVMQKQFEVIDSSEMLDDLSLKLQAIKQSILPVVHNGNLVGMVTMENVGEFMMIQNALKAQKETRNAIA
jgi:Zn-dependent protease/CBS domain-containing protein